jgi:zinc/manganese transport system substrate-binding protein/manganese/iron transport system substrate-binding protein
VLLAGCRDTGGGEGTQVVATTTQVADLARNVAGDRAEVTGLLAANSDPHDYEPRPSDAEAVGGAGLVLESGGDVDAWADDVVTSAGNDPTVVDLIDSVRTQEGEGGEVDPHWWQDPRNAVLAVEEIRRALTEADPDGAKAYARNAARYVAELRQLDRRIGSCMSSIPAQERKLVTDHDALGYYASRYGIDVVGAAIPALSTQAQPSAGETTKLVDQIRREGVKTIFPEAGLNPALQESLSRETGAKVGGELWADTLGPEGSSGATYLESLASNTETLADGFTGRTGTCRIPPG